MSEQERFETRDKRRFTGEGEDGGAPGAEKVESKDAGGVKEEGQSGHVDSGSGSSQSQPAPEPSFSNLVLGMATTAFIELGLIPRFNTGEKSSNLVEAKYLIDTLGILEEKTRGNLLPEEEKQLREILFNLRMSWVKVQEGRK